MILTWVRIRMAGTRRVSRVARDPRGARGEGLVVCIYHSGFDVLSWMGEGSQDWQGKGVKIYWANGESHCLVWMSQRSFLIPDIEPSNVSSDLNFSTYF